MVSPAHQLTSACDTAVWRCTDPLSPKRHREVIRTMNLHGCKWDTQLGDTTTLAPFALTLPREDWDQLASLAESLTRELMVIERRMTERPDLWPQLGLPPTLRRILESDAPWTPAAARIVRYDFHPTIEGWRISEVNSDVPGGFNEASTFTKLMATELGAKPAGDPLSEFARALGASHQGKAIALLTAPGYTEDLQVASGIGAALSAKGIDSFIARPEQLSWENDRALLRSSGRLEPLAAIYRFHQGEWLERTPAAHWSRLLRGGQTPVCNPGASILTESKRLPLLWRELHCDMPTWRVLLPETLAPTTPWRVLGADYVLKPAYCNTGDTVLGAGWQSRTTHWRAAVQAAWRSHRWITQRRFQTQTISTPHGARYPCLGIYTINGVASGIYARLSSRAVIDYTAQDVAILIA